MMVYGVKLFTTSNMQHAGDMKLNRNVIKWSWKQELLQKQVQVHLLFYDPMCIHNKSPKIPQLTKLLYQMKKKKKKSNLSFDARRA